MRSGRLAVSVWTRLAMGLALAAVALRVLVPAGFMPGGPGEATIVLCSSQGLQTVVVDGLSPHAPDPAGDHSGEPKTDHPCAFAGLAVAFTPATGLQAAPILWSAPAETEVPALAVAPGRGLAAPPPPATGPPLSI